MDAHYSPFEVIQNALFIGLGLFILTYTINSATTYFRPAQFPLVNSKRRFELSSHRARAEFAQNAFSIVTTQLKNTPEKPFRVLADVGEVTILPTKYAYEIRNHDDLSFTQATFRWFYAHLPGFEGFREGSTEGQIMKLVARHQLTHQLTKVTKPVSDECEQALKDIYSDKKEWHEISIKQANLEVMARISSRVFLGEKLCRDPDWLRITSTYTVVAFKAVEDLRFWPSYLRPIVHWYLPSCKAARKLVQEARDLINPLLDERGFQESKKGHSAPITDHNDAINWLAQTAYEKDIKYDPACAQLSLSVAALHSTTDFFTQVILDIAEHSEIIEPLRDEIRSVIGETGWTKNSLYNLKLMDSVMKESQRMKPIAIASMRRYATADVKLSDGFIIPRGTLMLVAANRHWDSVFYENPQEWNGYRFLNMRTDPAKSNAAHLVSATPEHMGFGYGLHACPGRFFASEEIKIALCHMLMNYDFKVPSGSDIKPRHFGFNMTANPFAKLAIRRREDFAVRDPVE